MTCYVSSGTLNSTDSTPSQTGEGRAVKGKYIPWGGNWCRFFLRPDALSITNLSTHYHHLSLPFVCLKTSTGPRAFFNHKQLPKWSGVLSVKLGFHYPCSRPKLTGDRFPLPVNTGRVDGRTFPLAELTGRQNGPSTGVVETGLYIVLNWELSYVYLHNFTFCYAFSKRFVSVGLSVNIVDEYSWNVREG